MGDKMNGVWKIKTSENFDEYMKELGVSFALRKMGNLAKPVLTIAIKDDALSFKSESSFRNLATTATINQEWDEETPDGRKCKSKFTWENGKLVQVQNWDGKTTKMVRWVDGTELKMELECNGVKASRVYVRKD